MGFYLLNKVEVQILTVILLIRKKSKKKPQIKEDAMAHAETLPESSLQRLQSVLIYSDGLIAG